MVSQPQSEDNLSRKEAKKLARQLLKKNKRSHVSKTEEQTIFLMNEWQKNPNLNKRRCKTISKAIGLQEIQIYKWFWDHSKGHHAINTLAERILASQNGTTKTN